MGCFPAKVKKFETKKIDHDFSNTYTLKLDQFFDEVKDCLIKIEQLRSNIEDNRDNLLKETYSIYLKSSSMKEALKIMFWCISANHQGKIQQTNPNLQASPPYLTMDLGNSIPTEIVKLWQYFTTYLNTVKDGPQIVNQEIDKYNKYLTEANSFVENGLQDILSVHQTQVQKAQAALNVSRNITKMQDQGAAVRRVKEVIDDARKEAEKITDFIEDLIKSADEVGEVAFKQGWLTPEEICLNYHPQLNKGASGDHEMSRTRSNIINRIKQ